MKRKSNKKENSSRQSKKHLRLPVIIGAMVAVCFIVFLFNLNFEQPVAAEDSLSEIEKAMYSRQEFFGANALVPLPTAEAREKLAKLAENQPDNPQLLEKLAELNEKLSNFDEAEKILIRLAESDTARFEDLAAFYERRARFDKEAEVLRKILSISIPEKRTGDFERLIYLARKHDLKEYLQKDFYQQIAVENPDVYQIFEKLADTLIEEENYPEALNFVRQAKAQFPARCSVLLDKEISILLATNNPKEAEKVYTAAFDPFWSGEEAEKFYNFLSSQDRLRAYGAELKARFKRNPADFDAAIRLALYQNHDYSYGNDDPAPIILKLENAKKEWTTEELVTVTRLLLAANKAENASCFLYTLYLREDFKKDSVLRAKVLYQLFEMFSDAEKQRLPLTKGDLRFYEDVAKTDTNPGITTGLLSLVFSDTNPRAMLEAQESEATKYYNRAAAYRIFLAYKEEFPASPELAQMYLDIVRLYTATKEPEIAGKTLDEFASKYENFRDYPVVALKLTDAYSATNRPEETREIYQKILNFFGKQGVSLKPAPARQSQTPNDSGAVPSANRNDGINIPLPEKVKDDYYGYEPPSLFHDYLEQKQAAATYSEVLEKLVSSLAKEKKTSEILAFYSNEIQKYPDEEWLYEQRLSWLEQTNLTEEQLKVYQSALARFQSRTWQDNLARWFLREKRQSEFAEFSTDLVGKLNDVETREFLSQFASGETSATDFQKRLYLKLYQSALKRFPHNPAFVQGLLRSYKANNQEAEWHNLAAEYYFAFKDVREQFLDDLAKKDKLRTCLEQATDESTIYEIFRADAYARLSNYENAVEAYRKLNQLYPHTPEFTERLIAFTRSFGQKSLESLNEAASLAQSQADFLPSSPEYRTRSGEIYAEIGRYDKSREEWEKLIETAKGEKETYLDTATVYCDYFQYDDALRTINALRKKFDDDALYAFESGAILESQHKKTEAIGEYIKALGDKQNETQKEKSAKRLAALYNHAEADKKLSGNILAQEIEPAFLKEKSKRKDSSSLILGYAEFLSKIKQEQKAEDVLSCAVRQSRDQSFIESARSFYQTADNKSGEQMTIARLAETTDSPRQKISYQLQLTEAYEDDQKRESAKVILANLVQEFPTNYGVLMESAKFYNRLGYENESVVVLQNALPKSRGQFRLGIARELASRLVRLNRLDDAREILGKLHEEDKANTEIFGELAKIDVRLSDAAGLRQAFDETVAGFKESNTDRRELNDQIAKLRGQMIDAFTRLKDYKSGIEQHIEIINREPDDESLMENAIKYVQRYGGAETLLNYYQKTAAQSFKNYRWNVVLARIYESQNNLESAAQNYQTAIINQPEMPELYLALSEIETKRNNFDAALKNIDEVLTLANDAPEYIRKKIEILKKAGRTAEAAAEQAKLPVEEESKVETEQFAEARNLQNSEKEKAREMYREAFGKLLSDPLSGELKAEGISGYVRSVREEESLGAINERLWALRVKLIERADKANSEQAGEARKRLSILDGALAESIGNIAGKFGTDEELAALHQDWQRRSEQAAATSENKHQELSLIIDLSRRAGFGDLEEESLLKKLETASLSLDRQIHLRNLVSFYNERGAYQKTFDLLEKYDTDNFPLKAETARISGNREKELEVLRAIYWKDNASLNSEVTRYLEILHSENREELKSLTLKSSSYQLQLINFLLSKGEGELAHSAIKNANLLQAWKVSRQAETSLALKELDENTECYFCEALQMDSIGSLVQQNPDKKRFLVGDDWFRLTREYGEWLYERQDKQTPPQKFLISMVENQPRNSAQQFKLGEFYLGKKEYVAAIEHFRLALELSPDDKTVLANLGAAYYLSDNKNPAEESWAKALENENINSTLPFFQTLQKYGLAAQAREKLSPLTVQFLNNNDADTSNDFQNLVRVMAESFANADKKSAYFREILRQRPTDTSLAAMLINDSLIEQNRQNEFYELLISRSQGLRIYDYDYNFTSVSQRSFSNQDAESVLDQETSYETEEPDNKRYGWQVKYVQWLMQQHENLKAEQTIKQIEKELSGRYLLPSQLRLAKIQLNIRAQRLNLPELERFIGISVSDSVTEIKPPSLERLNDVIGILKEENRRSEIKQLSESFFARTIALEQFNTANFTGLSRSFFEQGSRAQALQILQLMIDTSDETKKETALAQIAALDFVKSRAADTTKLSQDQNLISINQFEALQSAADLAAEFEQPEAAITFRRALLAANPSDTSNQIKFAKLLMTKGEKAEADSLLNQVISSRDAIRSARWEARMVLRESGESVEIPNNKYDAYSQFYNGILTGKNNQNELPSEYLINSLIAEKDTQVAARQELIKSYISLNKFFAALKLAESDTSAKSDELLQLLSQTAEKIGDFSRAINFEKAKNAINQEQINRLQKLDDAKNKKATYFTVDAENTRKL